MRNGYIIQKSEDKGKTWEATYWTNWEDKTFIEGKPRQVSRDAGRKYLKKVKEWFPHIKYRLVKIES